MAGVVGDWKLVSAQFEMADDGTLIDIYGPNPIGWLSLSASNRFYAILMASDRKVPSSDSELPGLFKTMMAYTGQWRIGEPNELVITVDTSWHPSWIGTEQIRYFEVQGDRLQIRTSRSTHPQMGTLELYGVLSWVRHQVA